MEKYELREGETFIEEYVDNEGKPVIIFEDTEGKVLHGWVIDLDDDVALMIERAAALEGISPQDYIDRITEEHITKLIEEDEKRTAIEEISD